MSKGNSQEVAACLDTIRKILNKEASEIAKLPSGPASELRKAADALVKKLDCVLIQPDPERKDVEGVLEGLEDFNFTDMSKLVDDHLLPLLLGNVTVALENEKPAVAQDMMVPILAFFNRYRGNLDDSERRSHAFLSAWAELLGDALSMYESSGTKDLDPAIVHDLYSELQELQDAEKKDDSILNLLAHLEALLAQDEAIKMYRAEDEEEEEEEEVEEEGGRGRPFSTVPGVASESSDDEDDEREEEEVTNMYSGEEEDEEEVAAEGNFQGSREAKRVRKA